MNKESSLSEDELLSLSQMTIHRKLQRRDELARLSVIEPLIRTDAELAQRYALRSGAALISPCLSYSPGLRAQLPRYLPTASSSTPWLEALGRFPPPPRS